MTNNLPIITKDLISILEVIPQEPHKSTERGLYSEDVDTFIDALAKAKKRVRVYSKDGFVPNKYKWGCWIRYLEGKKGDDGWTFTLAWTGAQRSHGNGNLVVIQ